jgi:Flp pilus assembly protein TadD
MCLTFWTAGAIYGELGRLPEAEALLRKALDLQPLNPDGHVTLAHIIKAQGNMAGAIEVLEGAAKLDPSDPDIACTLGNIQREAGDLGAASTSFQNAPHLDEAHAASWAVLGELF